MSETKIAVAASDVAKNMASALLKNSDYNGLPLEDLVDKACHLDQTRNYFLNHGIDLNDDTIQLEALCEFQKALTEEIISLEN